MSAALRAEGRGSLRLEVVVIVARSTRAERRIGQSVEQITTDFDEDCRSPR
jgi:hypothetical protein